MVNKEEVRMLVAAIGYEEASKQTGIKAGTLRQWALRYKWKAPIQHSQAKTVTTVTKPSDALATVLSEDRDKTKIGFSRAARKVAEAQAELPVETLRMPKEALAAKSWTDVAARSQGWDSEAGKDQGVLGGLQVIAGQAVIQVNPRSSNSASDV